jgi:hypothetical protein
MFGVVLSCEGKRMPPFLEVWQAPFFFFFFFMGKKGKRKGKGYYLQPGCMHPKVNLFELGIFFKEKDKSKFLYKFSYAFN